MSFLSRKTISLGFVQSTVVRVLTAGRHPSCVQKPLSTWAKLVTARPTSTRDRFLCTKQVDGMHRAGIFTSHVRAFRMSHQHFYSTNTNDEEIEIGEGQKRQLGEITPRLAISYKCKICNNRNIHTFSRKAYEEGVVIVECSHCKSNHLIADNLGWFNDINKRNIEEILAAKGEEVKRMGLDDMEVEIPTSVLEALNDKGRG